MEHVLVKCLFWQTEWTRLWFQHRATVCTFCFIFIHPYLSVVLQVSPLLSRWYKMRHRLLPLCALLGVLLAGLPPNLEAQEGKLNLVYRRCSQQSDYLADDQSGHLFCVLLPTMLSGMFSFRFWLSNVHTEIYIFWALMAKYFRNLQWNA